MLTQQDIEKIIRETSLALAGQSPVPATAVSEGNKASVPVSGSGNGWMFATVDEAVSAAKEAQRILQHSMTLEQRGRIISSIRERSLQNARYLAELAHNETGYGSVEHKVLKNRLAAEKTPGLEDLQTQAFSGDDGITLVEQAPFGVIGSITPSTNPTATVINNSISMIAAGNAVVFNPHPAAKHASQEAMRIVNEAVVAAGGPNGLVCCIAEPTLETGLQIMKHKDIPAYFLYPLSYIEEVDILLVYAVISAVEMPASEQIKRQDHN